MKVNHPMKKCLMIQTKDNKKLFTHEKNLPQLVEFSKTFNAEISVVQLYSESDILELEELAPAFCEKKTQNAKYKLIEIKLKPKYNRNKILNRAKSIKKYIKNNLMRGYSVSLKELILKYNKYKLTNACLCNHFKQVRLDLIEKGYLFEKTGGGSYKLK